MEERKGTVQQVRHVHAPSLCRAALLLMMSLAWLLLRTTARVHSARRDIMCSGHYGAEVLSLVDIKIVRAVIAMRGQRSRGLSFPCFPMEGWQSHHPRLTPSGSLHPQNLDQTSAYLASLGVLGPAICGQPGKYSGTSYFFYFFFNIIFKLDCSFPSLGDKSYCSLFSLP